MNGPRSWAGDRTAAAAAAQGGGGAGPQGPWATVGRAALAVASVATLAALLVGGRLAEAVFAAACVVFPVALIVLGAARRGRLGRALGLSLAALLTILAVSFLVLFAVRGQVEEGPWVAGLPLGTAVLLGGVWLLPLALVGLAYALTFDGHGLGPDDLERLRRATSPSGSPGEAGADAAAADRRHRDGPQPPPAADREDRVPP